MNTVIAKARAAYWAAIGAVASLKADAISNYGIVKTAVAGAVAAGLLVFNDVAASVVPFYSKVVSAVRGKVTEFFAPDA